MVNSLYTAKKTVNFTGNRFTVIGLARSGVGAANLLAGLGARVTVMDNKGYSELDSYIKKLEGPIDYRLGPFDEELLLNSDTIVVSPGVPLTLPALERAAHKGVRIIGELELAYEVADKYRKNAAAGFLAITGTNGKSTTTTLVYEILRNSGLDVFIGGNIGLALTDEVRKLLQRQYGRHKQLIPDYIVTEVSSFQLESIDMFKPKGAAILNITPDHLDRHASMEEYIDAKCRIFMNQDPLDFLVLNADDPLTPEIAGRVKEKGPEIVYFSRKRRVKGAFVAEGQVCFHLPEQEILCPELMITDMPVLKISDFKIKGVHNIENALAASLVALLSGACVEDIQYTLMNFNGLEHRLEFVAEIDGVKYINDSKGTNVSAVVKSLESFDEPLVLIAGGKDKGGDFEALRPYIKDRVKTVVLIGEASDKIAAALKDLTGTRRAGDMQEAVEIAKEIACTGEAVLLSPACASFDMYQDFEERGRVFKEAVQEMKKEQQA